MNRVRAWLMWSPFARGTWQHLALNLVIVLATMTIVQACLGDLNASSWLAGLTGVAIVGVAVGVSRYRSGRRPTAG